MSIEDQPPPIAQPERVPVWDLVIADLEKSTVEAMLMNDVPGTVIALALNDMRDRDRVGRERYGVPLTTHNGRDHLVDAYQEALDQCAYLRAEIEERATPMVMRVYAITLSCALSIRGAIYARELMR